MINIKDFDARLLKIDKISYKHIGIYNIGYITQKKIDDYENIYSVNPLYLIIANASGYIKEEDLNTLYLNINHASECIKEKRANKYLVFDSTDGNKELLEKYIVMFGMELRTKSKKQTIVSVIMKKIT